MKPEKIGRGVRSLELDPARLDQLAAHAVQEALGWMHSLDGRSIRPDASGQGLHERFRSPIPEEGLGEEAFDLTEVFESSRAQNGRFFGYVMGSAEPASVLGDLVASALNQNVTSWRSGPAATTIELALVDQLARELGCDGFSGCFCGGGSSGNLIGLAMARESKCPANERGARPAVVYASSEVHMSVPKAVALLGLGRNNLRLVEVDEHFRMRADALERAVAFDIAAGKTPIAVVATAGTVATGAVDPLEAIATVARKHELHLHVDGAYGGLAALAAPERIGPLGLADSVSLDLHKWLYQPIDCGLVLFRDRALARRTFTYTDDYVASFADDPREAFLFFEETLELSRRFRALKVWLSLRYHGLGRYRASIREDLDLASELARRIDDNDRLQLLASVELSAVCFRVHAVGSADIDEFNRSVLSAVNERGRAYLSNATLNGSFALRACITNHRTTTEDLNVMIDEVLDAAAALLR
jgi:glutamate/tyrosine decarboxylase-like PLP-dependent enzyme